MNKKESSSAKQCLQDMERRRFLGGLALSAGAGVIASLGVSGLSHATQSPVSNRVLVTTPTGNIGHQVLENILSSGFPIRVIDRDPSRIPSSIKGQIEVVQGSHSDPAVVDEALKIPILSSGYVPQTRRLKA